MTNSSIPLQAQFHGVDLPGIEAAAQRAAMNDQSIQANQYKLQNAPLAAEVERMKLQDDQGRMSALAGYRKSAATEGPVSPLGQLDAYPEDQTQIYSQLDKAFSGMTFEQKQQAVQRSQAIGRAAQFVASFPDGSPQQRQAWENSIRALQNEGWMSPQDAQAQIASGPNRNIINSALQLEDYVKKAAGSVDDPLQDLRRQKLQLEVNNLQSPRAKSPPASIQAYEYYADQERTDGREPMSYGQWEKETKGGTTVNIGGEPKEDKFRAELDKADAKRWGEIQQQADVSGSNSADFAVLDQLIAVAPQGPLTGRLADMFPGFSSSGDAFQSIVKRIAPTLRTAGSGATSDIEYDGMLRSLPALKNSQQANMLIKTIMEAKAEINIEKGRIVTQFQVGEIPLAEARRLLDELNKKSILTPEMKQQLDIVSGSGPVVVDGYTIKKVTD